MRSLFEASFYDVDWWQDLVEWWTVYVTFRTDITRGELMTGFVYRHIFGGGKGNDAIFKLAEEDNSLTDFLAEKPGASRTRTSSGKASKYTAHHGRGDDDDLYASDVPCDHSDAPRDNSDALRDDSDAARNNSDGSRNKRDAV